MSRRRESTDASGPPNGFRRLWTLKLVCKHDDRELMIDRISLDPRNLGKKRSVDYPVLARLDYRGVSQVTETWGDWVNGEWCYSSKFRALCRDTTGPHARPIDVALTWPRFDDVMAAIYRNRRSLWPTGAPCLELRNLEPWAAKLASSSSTELKVD